jgi:hypothetical protein
MTTLADVTERVANMSKNHTDKSIRTKDISFESLNTVRIGSDAHTLRPIAQQAISNRLGVPINYLRRCPDDVQALNMNHWIKYEKNEQLFFRFDGDEVKSIVHAEVYPG